MECGSLLQGSGRREGVCRPSARPRDRRNPAGDGLFRGYQTLQAGIVDGAENSPSNFYTQKMHEVQKT